VTCDPHSAYDKADVHGLWLACYEEQGKRCWTRAHQQVKTRVPIAAVNRNSPQDPCPMVSQQRRSEAAHGPIEPKNECRCATARKGTVSHWALAVKVCTRRGTCTHAHACHTLLNGLAWSDTFTPSWDGSRPASSSLSKGCQSANRSQTKGSMTWSFPVGTHVNMVQAFFHRAAQKGAHDAVLPLWMRVWTSCSELLKRKRTMHSSPVGACIHIVLGAIQKEPPFIVESQ